jgi:hypothetical protein
LAERTLESGDSDESRAALMFRRATGRRPRAEEVRSLVQGIQSQRTYFQEHVDRANKLVAVGVRPADGSHDRAELATWTMTANMLLNLDEVITKN